MDLERDGWGKVQTSLDECVLDELRDRAFQEGSVGSRCHLDLPIVVETAKLLKQLLIDLDFLPATAIAIQAITFNKTASTNWNVAWHQDLVFPFAKKVRSPEYRLASRKQGINYAQPPLGTLQNLLALRLHLDDCGFSNGPLRVSPGTHKKGIVPSVEAAEVATRNGEVACIALKGEAIVMRPLLLHASSTATKPINRRVLHFVFHTGEEQAEAWHRAR